MIELYQSDYVLFLRLYQDTDGVNVEIVDQIGHHVCTIGYFNSDKGFVPLTGISIGTMLYAGFNPHALVFDSSDGKTSCRLKTESDTKEKEKA